MGIAKQFSMRVLALLLLSVSFNCGAQVKLLYHEGWLSGPDDTLKGNIKKLTEYSTSFRDSAIKVYTCDTAAKTETALFYEKQKLLGKWVVQFDAYGNIIETGLYCDSTILSTGCYNKYDAKGRKTESTKIQYNAHCHYLTNWLIDGIVDYAVSRYPIYSITLYTYDSMGRLKDDITRDYENGDRDTLFKVNRYSYDRNGQLVEKEEKTWGGNRPLEIRTTKYDCKGREIEFNYVNKDGWFNSGQPIIKKKIWVYDSLQDRITERKLYDLSNYKPDSAYQNQIFVGSSTTYQYDTQGNNTSNSTYNLYWGNNGSESRQHRVTLPVEKSYDQKAYDNHGNMIKRNNYGYETVREIEYFN
jgi:hypothetical protein